MITFDEALGLIGKAVAPLQPERVALAEAAGRVLMEPLHARRDSPRVAVATMDGYAVCDADAQAGEALRVIGESRAGSGYSGTVGSGEAVRIFTGAPIPHGADRCIIQEHAVVQGDKVRFTEGYGPAWHVRPAGSDFTAGDLLLSSGTRLTPRAMVAAAAADVASLKVSSRPRIAIIGTGDELAPPGAAYLRDDAVPDSVTLGVAAMAGQAGGKVVARTIGLDDLPTLEVSAGTALEIADLVVVTGGASVGERDFAKPMFASHGLELVFSKVAIKPGKPVWLGQAAGKWVLGLPGNPTSAMVTARLFLRPLLARLQGQAIEKTINWRTLPLAAPLAATEDRETFVRARWDFRGLTPLSNQDSGSQGALWDAGWLIRCAPGGPARSAGELVDTLPFECAD